MSLNEQLSEEVRRWTARLVADLKERVPSVDTGSLLTSISQDGNNAISMSSYGRVLDMRPKRGTSAYRIDKFGYRVKRLDRNRKNYNSVISAAYPDLIDAITEAAINFSAQRVKDAFEL